MCEFERSSMEGDPASAEIVGIWSEWVLGTIQLVAVDRVAMLARLQTDLVGAAGLELNL